MRRALLGLALAAGVVTSGGVAFGHASLDKSSVPAASEQALQVRVPVERAGAYNTQVSVEVPAGFTALGCSDKLGWTCTVTLDTERGRSAVVTWKRTSGIDAIDLLDLRVRTPDRAGTYPIEINQTYSTGEVAQWDGPPDGDHPAPQLEVTGAGSAPQENRAEPAPHAGGAPPPAAGEPAAPPAAAPAPAPAAAAAGGGSASGASAGGEAPAPAAVVAAQTPAGAAVAEPAAAEPVRAAASPVAPTRGPEVVAGAVPAAASPSDGLPGAVVAAAVVALLASAAGGLLLRRRARRQA